MFRKSKNIRKKGKTKKIINKHSKKTARRKHSRKNKTMKEKGGNGGNLQYGNVVPNAWYSCQNPKLNPEFKRNRLGCTTVLDATANLGINAYNVTGDGLSAISKGTNDALQIIGNSITLQPRQKPTPTSNASSTDSNSTTTSTISSSASRPVKRQPRQNDGCDPGYQRVSVVNKGYWSGTKCVKNGTTNGSIIYTN